MHTLANGISIGYIIAIIYSIILSFITPSECFPASGRPVIKPITLFIYISTLVAALARSVMSSSIFKSFDPLIIMITLVLSLLMLVLMVFLLIFRLNSIDMYISIYYLIVITIHSAIIVVVFKRVTKLA